MRVLWVTTVILAIDQFAKLVVMRSMYVGQSIPLIGDWLKLTFTENPGMAFGINFGPRGLVTLLSIAATLLIFLYMFKVRKSYSPYRASIAFILGGALGNIIDRVFYGVIFNNEPLFAGKVVDFIHVNLWRGYLPEAWPLVGGKYAALFPIWNIADMAIVCGVLGILFFQHKFQESLQIGTPAGDETSALSTEYSAASVVSPIALPPENGSGAGITSQESMDQEESSRE